MPQSYQQALEWYRKAADEGDAGAMNNIGILYYNAEGVERDLVEAYAWFARVQKHGDPRAAELISWASENMTRKQIEKAQALAGE